MFTNAYFDIQVISQHRAELIAEADRYRLLAAARRQRRARRHRRP